MSRIIESDRITYIYLKLVDAKQKKFIEELIKRLEIASISTARRRFKDIDEKFSKSEKKLFLATYTPTKSDSEAIDDVLGLNASKVSSEVVEEPVSDNKQFEEELKYGDTVEFEGKKYKFVETGKFTSDDCQMCDLFINDEEPCICSNYIYNVMGYFKQEDDKHTECDIEAAHIINELSAKNEELQKEIEILKLNILERENSTKKWIENCEEIKIKYENLLEVLETKKLDIELNPKYDSLYKVLLSAYNQASNGKGKERHQLNDEEPFENQKICEIARRLSIDYNLGQAVKKIYESKRLTDGRDIAELYGAINYIAAAIIVKQEE